MAGYRRHAREMQLSGPPAPPLQKGRSKANGACVPTVQVFWSTEHMPGCGQSCCLMEEQGGKGADRHLGVGEGEVLGRRRRVKEEESPVRRKGDDEMLEERE